MAVQLDDMVAQVRVDSGLRSNPLFSDAQIAKLLTKGQAKLRDVFIQSFSFWFRKSHRFTLNGGVAGNTLDLSLIPDFQMAQYLNRNPDSATPEPITLLGSIAERTFGNGIPPGWVGGRKYFIDGDELAVLPIDNSQGDYELIYTSMGLDFQAPVTRNFQIATTDLPIVSVPGLPGNWILANAAFTADIPIDGSAKLTLAFTTTNLAFNGTYFITQVLSATDVQCSNLVSSAGYTNPATGSGTYTYQPIGTQSALPQVLTPWADYIMLYACIKVRQSRRQSAGDLTQLFVNEEARATKAAKTRSQGTKQAPMTHNRHRRRGYSYGQP